MPIVVKILYQIIIFIYNYLIKYKDSIDGPCIGLCGYVHKLYL